MAAAALITGANRGLGLELVRQLALSHRTGLIIAAARNPDQIPKVVVGSEKVRPVRLDVTDFDSMPEFGRTVDSILGDAAGLDLLVNNAGVSPGLTRFSVVTPEQMEATFRANVVGPLMLSKCLLPALKRSRDAPLVVNMSSVLGSVGLNKGRGGGIYPYRVSKAALNMLTRNMALDLASSGVSAVALHPGWVKTRLGGPNAPLQTEEAVNKIIAFIRNFRADEHNGNFYDCESGNKLEW